jgi:NitT/TauT family transport system substrate-binding protein
MVRKKSITSAGVSVALALGLFAAEVQFAGGQELKLWRHGILDAKSDAGFFFMIDQGFAERQGLKLKLYQFKSDTHLLQALLAGELDSFEGGPGNSIMAAARGADVKIVGCTWPGLPNVILARGLTSVQDLKGRVVAVGPSGSLPELLVRVLLDQYNIPASAVQFSSIGNDHDRYRALVAHVIDVAIVANEFIPFMEQQGLRLLAAANDFAPNFLRMCIQSTTNTLATRADDAAHFMAAEILALRYATSHREQTLELTRKMAREKEDDPRPGFMFDWAVKTQALDPEAGIPVDKLTYIQEQLIKIGKLSKPFDVTKMLDSSIREKALQLIGK